MLTTEQVANLVPKNKRNLINDELMDKINTVASDPLMSEEFKANFLTYSNVMQQGKFSVIEYKSAVHFVTCKLLGDLDVTAYIKVFPDRYERLLGQGLDRSSISPYVSAYKNNKLITAIMEQTLVPTYIVNAPMYQEALNVQADLMMNARSEMVRSVAASAILTQLKAPESAKLEVDITLKKDSIVDDYENVMRELAKQKRAMMTEGGDVKAIANFDLAVEAEIIEETE